MHGKRFEPRDLEEEEPVKRARLSDKDENIAKLQPVQRPPPRFDANNNSTTISLPTGYCRIDYFTAAEL